VAQRQGDKGVVEAEALVILGVKGIAGAQAKREVVAGPFGVLADLALFAGQIAEASEDQRIGGRVEFDAGTKTWLCLLPGLKTNVGPALIQTGIFILRGDTL